MTSPQPLVTIITPVYNAERFIGKCIESVLGQTYPNWEQLIVDDGSTDRTAEIVRGFSDPRIHFISLPHRGLTALAETYNEALNRSKGELVAVLEGDDYWPSDKLEVQTRAFNRSEVVLTWGRSYVVDDDNVVRSLWTQPREGRITGPIPLKQLFHVLTRTNALVPSATVMVRRTALERIGGFRQFGGAIYVDFPTWLSISAAVDGIAEQLPHNLAYYRVHSGQTSSQRAKEMRFLHYDVVKTLLSELDANDLARLGWNDERAAAAAASADLQRGLALMRSGEKRGAREHFVRCMRSTRTWPERFGAAIGLVSTITGLDLIKAAERMRVSQA